ncbi:MAG: hypothetical protein WC936_07080 [Candidatus Nanoarchaeia archaeon]|jgi:hypothetical protein
MSSITVTKSGVDLSGFVWRYMTVPKKAAIYTYHQIKGATAGYLYSQGTDSATFTVYGRCAQSAANSAIVQALTGSSVTVASDIHGTFSCYVTDISFSDYNSIWMQFSFTVRVV